MHRAEEKLKIASGELQTLRAKVEKLESDRNFLKDENQSLEGKVSDRHIEELIQIVVKSGKNKNRSLSPVDYFFSLSLALAHLLRSE